MAGETHLLTSRSVSDSSATHGTLGRKYLWGENACVFLTIEYLQIGPIALQVVLRAITRTPCQDGLADSSHRSGSRNELQYEKKHDSLYHDIASLRLGRLPENRQKLIIGTTENYSRAATASRIVRPQSDAATL